MPKDKTKHDKKRKAGPSSAAAPAVASASSSTGLFGSVRDAALDDLFSKGDAFARPTSIVQPPAVVAAAETRPPKKAKKAAAAAEPVRARDSDDDSDAVVAEPAASASAASASRPQSRAADRSAAADRADDSADDDSDDSEGDPSELVHESVAGPRAKRDRGKKTKYVPPGETAADRDRRTVFVGNLAVEVAKSKSAARALRAHILTFAPGAKIESVRFRSVALSTPTTALPSDDPERDATRRARKERERAAVWRAQQAGGDGGGASAGRKTGEEGAETPKVFLDAKGKRKVAVIKGEFHAELATCNAYIVFAYAAPDRAPGVPAVLDPFEAAARARAADGSTLLGRTIKVDALRAPSAAALVGASTALARRDAWLPAGADPKRSLFVGGLDYAARDDDVRAFFEALVVAERGERPATAAGAAGEGDAAAPGKWVTAVRIVRDKDTQLGKGFGYVHFVDRESVDEIIAMDSKRLKFAKRPLRVQPCRTLPPKAPAQPANAAAAPARGAAPARTARAARPGPATPAPRGDPALGDRLRDLSKQDRKAAKAADETRQARRLAKKQKGHARDAAAAAGARERVSLAPTKAERQRTERKVKAKKGRVRSAHALTKMKGARE